MKDIKKMPKMQHFKTGGRVQKYEEGGEVEPSAWHVYDNQTKARVNRTEYKSLKTASRAVDRLDDAYGGYRYSVKAAPSQPEKAGPVNMTGFMGNTGGKPETANYRSGTGGGGGGGGGVGGLKNLLDPDSPLNRKKGGTIRRYKK